MSTVVQAEVDAAVTVLHRNGIGAPDMPGLARELVEAIKAAGAGVDNTLPTPPPTAGNELPGGVPPTPSQPLPTPPFPGGPDQSLPTPPAHPDQGLPPMTPRPGHELPGHEVPPPNQTLPEAPPHVSGQPVPGGSNPNPDLNPDIDLPEHAEPKGKGKK